MGRQSVSDRFWSRVDRSAEADGCWLWLGSLKAGGYGRFPVGGGRYRAAHRLAWELSFGEIPAGLFVLHRCDVPRCVNASHLFLGSHADNMADMVAKGRGAKISQRRSVCKYGHPRLAGSRLSCPTCQRVRMRERMRQRRVGVVCPVVDLAALLAASNGTGSKPLGLEPVVRRRAGVSVSTADSAP